MTNGTRVEIIGLNLFGVISNTRVDSHFDPIYTITLDDPSATPTGLFVARQFEIRGVQS